MMQNDTKSETALRVPLQVAPVVRSVVSSPIFGDAGIDACDNNNNPIWDCPS